MSFFAGASNIKIVGGEFNDIKGNLTVFDHSRHEVNIDSGNVYNNKIIDSFNDNSTRISGRNPRPRYPRNDEDDQMESMASTSEDDRGGLDHTGPPPPQHPRFMPPQMSSGGGHVINKDSFNVKNTQMDDAFNDYSKTHYHGRAPPINQRRRVGPQRQSVYEEEEEDLQSNSGSLGNGQFKAPGQVFFQGGLPQHVGNGRGSGPPMSVVAPIVQQMDPNMRRNFSKLMKYTLTQTNASDDDDEGSSSSHNMNVEESMTPRMAEMSINDPVPSSTSRDSSHTHLSAPTTFSRTKSDPQIAQSTTPQVDHAMSSSSPSHPSPNNNALHHAHSNPSLAPHMKNPTMVQFLSQPNTAHPGDVHGNNDPNKPPPVSTSGFNFPPSSNGGPIFRTIDGNLTKHDHSFNQTNLNSFNTENNTTQNSFNDNSVVDSSGKQKATKKRRFFSRRKD